MLYFFCTNKHSETVVPFRFYDVQESLSENYLVRMSKDQGKSSISVTVVMGQWHKDGDEGNAMSILCVSVIKDGFIKYLMMCEG